MSSTRIATTAQEWGRWLGPLVALASYFVLPATYLDSNGHSVIFSAAGRATTATTLWMAIWWMTEATPLAVTALLPLALFPLLGAASIQEAAAPYANETIFLFLGGFLLALALERWELHRRFAFSSLRCVGTNPLAVVAAFMGVTAFLSMWLSNTATALMMLPIALSVIALVDAAPQTASEQVDLAIERKNFALCLLLGIAYSASIGGIGTLIGTPPNLFLASYLKNNLHTEISFVRWMSIGVPLVLLFVPAAWWMLTRIVFPIRDPNLLSGLETIFSDSQPSRDFSVGAKVTLIVFFATAAAWIFRPLLIQIQIFGLRPLAGLSDSGIAIFAAITLFLIPVDRSKKNFVMNWETALRVPWGLLILFGGGLSLASAIQKNGVGEFLASHAGVLAGMTPIGVILLSVGFVVFLTEVMSNTAATATIVPILASFAPTLQIHPFALIIPATIAASCGFMLPVGTPPNAIVFGTQRVKISEMCRAGLYLNLFGILLISFFTYFLLGTFLGISISNP